MNIQSLDLDSLDLILDDLVDDKVADDREIVLPERPFFLLDRITFDAELSYVLASGENESDGLVPVYFRSGDVFTLLGNFYPSVDLIIRIKYLGLDVTFYRRDGTDWDFSLPEHYYSLIRL